MFTKQDILDAIQKTAKENGGVPPGATRFEQSTSYRPYDWRKYWVRFSDLLKEAGLTPNRQALEQVYSTDDLVEQVIILMRKLGRFPLIAELRVERTKNQEFPHRAILKRLFPKKKCAQMVIEYSKSRKGYEDIIKIAEPILDKDEKSTESEGVEQEQVGAVYLFKHGRYYKIGKTNDTVRRGNELKTQLPEKLDLIHEIKTDDPSGVEAYWHRRFDERKMNGEWFDLSSADVKAFKHWRRII